MADDPTLMRRISLTILVGLAALGAQVAPASARKSLPPKVTLHAGRMEIPGRPWQVTWATGATGGEAGRCSGFVADGIPSYRPTPPLVAKGVRRATIVLHRARRPRRVVVRAHHYLGDDGYPSGHSQRLPVRLVAGHRSGQIKYWRATLPLRSARRYYYLDVHVVYWGSGPCGGGGGNMDLAFSVRTGPYDAPASNYLLSRQFPIPPLRR